MPWADLIYKYRLPLFYSAAFISLVFLVLGFIMDVLYLGLFGFAIVGALIALYDFKIFFYLLLLVLPISDEIEITSGLRMHFPTEPLIILLLFLFVPYVILNHKLLKGSFWKHPITIIIIVNLLWILITVISSTHQLVSIKYLIAKIWFVTIYYFLASHIITSYNKFKKVILLLVFPTIAGLTYVLIRHGIMGFSFDAVSSVVRPIYRNHVDYGVWIAAIFPLLLLVRTWFKPQRLGHLFFTISIVLTAVAIYFSFTRGAWVAISTIPVFYLIIRTRLVKPAIILTSVVTLIFLGSLFHQNKYLKYAPDFDKTISHSEFSDHLSATFQMQDMSTVERFYRWIAAVKMFRDKPITGFGPGNFVNNYKEYTVTAYQTYISDNEEGSSVHNYFLTMLTEQGIPGLVIFVILIFTILIYFQKVYHQTEDVKDKRLVMAVACCFFVLLVNNVFSDLLEADKLGPLFFMCTAILVNWDLKSRKSSTETYKLTS